MRHLLIGLTFLASAAQADDFCGITDKSAILHQVEGTWDVTGGIAMDMGENSGLDVIQASLLLNRDGIFRLDFDEGAGATIIIRDGEQPYGEDEVAKILERIPADWVAEAISSAPCRPTDVLQLSGRVERPSESSWVTVLPYSTEEMVLFVEMEVAGEGGVAFVSIAAILTPQE